MIRRASLSLLLCLGFLLGCADAERRDVLGPASGIVTFQDKPVTAGEVLFDNGQGIARMASLGPDGSYTILSADGVGLPVGSYKVAIQPPRLEHPLGPINEPPKPRIFPNIPDRYRDVSTSGLTADVKSGGAPLNFNMKP